MGAASTPFRLWGGGLYTGIQRRGLAVLWLVGPVHSLDGSVGVYLV